MTDNTKHTPHFRKGLISNREKWSSGNSLRSVGAYRKFITGAVPVFFVAFLATFMASSIFTPMNSSDATTTVTAKVNAEGYYVSIVDPGDLRLSLNTTPVGAMTVASTTIKTATNSPSGYKLYMGIAPIKSDGTLKNPTELTKTGLYLAEDYASTTYIAPVDGTATSPAALDITTDGGTWGYAVDKNTTGAPSTWTSLNHTTQGSGTLITDELYAAVPAYGNEDLIQTTTSANVSINTEESALVDSDYTRATLYFGVAADMSKPSGDYSNTVAFTAMSEATPDGSALATLYPAVYYRNGRYDLESSVMNGESTKSGSYKSNIATWDDTLTITTSIYTNMPDLGTATVTLSGGPQNVSNLACENPELSSVNSLLTITCTLPQAYAGTYTLHVEVPKYDYSIDKSYTYAVNWATISAMQEMTPSVCETANSPDGTTNGADVTTAQKTKSNPAPELFLKELRADGGGHITANYVTDSNGIATVNAANGTKNIDSYNYQEATTGYYRIRKLADDNCWMTENMDMPQTTSQVYHPYDTNVTSNWSPNHNYITTPGETTTGTEDRTYYGNGSAGTRYVQSNDSESTSGFAAETQSIGTYYTWGAAVAGNGAVSSGTVPVSVCPKGWILPNGGNSATEDSFAKLLVSIYGYQDNADGQAAARRYPMSYVFSGDYYWGDGKLYYQGAYGNWWSSTPSGATTAYDFFMNSTRLIPQNNYSRYSGLSIRCISAP